MSSVLLPSNATSWERAVADAAVPPEVVTSAIRAIRGAKLDHPVPAMLPFIVWEFGIGELTPYVPNLYQIIDDGIDWQRVRGTPMAVAKGLAWLGYAAAIEEARASRKFWNSFQLRFASLPANDDPLLGNLAGVTQLSVPKRSQFRRGVHQYDIGPVERDNTRLDGAMLDNESGIRLEENGPVWSFGRVHQSEHLLTEAEGLAAGNWQSTVFYEEPAALIDFDNDIYSIGDETLTRSEFEAAYFTRDDVADTLAMTAAGAVFDGDVDESLRLPLADAGVPETEGAFIWRGEITATHTGAWSRVFEIGSDSSENLISIFVGSDGNLSVNVTRGTAYLGGATLGTSPIGAVVQTIGVAWSGSSVRIRINDAATVFGAAALAFSEDEERPVFGDVATDAVVKQISVFKRYLTANEFEEAMDKLIAGNTEGPEVEDAAEARWIDLDITWEDADFPWTSSPLEVRAAALATWYAARGTYFALKDAEDNVVGYRRVRAAHVVEQEDGGIFGVSGASYSPSDGGGKVYFEAMSDFGQADADIASIALVVGGALASGVKPGKLWIAPDELTGGVEIASQSVAFPLRQTVREQIKLLLRF